MILLPRLNLTDKTIGRLKHLAAQRNLSVGQVIEDILENRTALMNNEVMFRLILVAERFGLGVGGTRLFPSSWVDVAGLSEAKCRELAASYIAWKRRYNENQERDC